MTDTKDTLDARYFVGSCESYVIGDNFDNYLRRVNNYFSVNSVTSENFKVNLLVNVLGPIASTKLMDAFLPGDYSTKSFVEVVAKCKDLFSGKRNAMVQRHIFFNRSQEDGETLVDFAINLQLFAEHCKFKEYHDHALRDRFVCGLRCVKMKKVLLKQKEESSFEEIVEIAKAEEAASAGAESMKIAEAVEVNKVGRWDARGKPKFKNAKNDRHKNSNREGGNKDRRNANSSEVQCYRCKGFGHFAFVCPSKDKSSKGRGQKNSTNHVIEDLCQTSEFIPEQEEDPDSDTEFINRISRALGESVNGIKAENVKLLIEDTKLSMEVDTGSCVSVCGKDVYMKQFQDKKIFKSELRLSVVSGEHLKVIGKILVRVQTSKGNFKLWLHVIDTKKFFTPLLGRDWLDKLCDVWREAIKINQVKTANSVNESIAMLVERIKCKYAKICDDDLSEPIKNFVVDIKMNVDAKPFVHRPYTLPFNVRDRVKSQLDNLVKEGILEKIEYAKWGSPMVVVVKSNKDLRLCIDGSKTINPHIETHHYPLPVIDELLANKSNAKLFCVLDLKGAYQQLVVNEETKKLLAINTAFGMYAYKRLPFGVKPAASIFQSVMDQILSGLDDVQCYIDDILIWGSNVKELYDKVHKVLSRLLEFNVHINWAKCQWFVRAVTYLGHLIDSNGISPNPEKIKAIAEAPEPQNVTQLKSFIGMIMFYSKFLKDLSVTLAPLYQLLKKEFKWNWSSECRDAFVACKKSICSKKLLVHYDPKKEIIITCDASNDGISGVLSHMINGGERPVFFVSRTLTKSERNYPILHREALAVVFAMEKFYKYIYGNRVVIFTDHKPLVGIFGSNKGEPPVVANRLQRYAIRLSLFDFDIKYRRGKDNQNADCLSRLPINEKPSQADEQESRRCEIKNICGNAKLQLNFEKIREATTKDKILRVVNFHILNGWDEGNIKPELKSFFEAKESLNSEYGVILRGSRVVIPTTLREATLKVLHKNHLGVSRMKQVAREYVFWGGINKDIENFVGRCESCQVLQKDKPKVYDSWPIVTFPFERVHMDFFHFKGKNFLILVDVYSRWLEVRQMSHTNAAAVIKELENIYSIFGSFKEIVSDNGPPFTSSELKRYFEKKNTIVTHTPPYHPASNGSIERAVQTVKSVLRKFANDYGTNFQITKAIDEFLTNYRNQPHTNSKVVPTQKLFTFNPRTILNCLSHDQGNEEFYKTNRIFLKGKELPKSLKFELNEKVFYISKVNGYCYAYPAEIVKVVSKCTYLIKIERSTRLAHINQLRKHKFYFFSSPDTSTKDRSYDTSPTSVLPAPNKRSPSVEPEPSLPIQTGTNRRSLSVGDASVTNQPVMERRTLRPKKLVNYRV